MCKQGRPNKYGCFSHARPCTSHPVKPVPVRLAAIGRKSVGKNLFLKTGTYVHAAYPAGGSASFKARSALDAWLMRQTSVFPARVDRLYSLFAVYWHEKYSASITGRVEIYIVMIPVKAIHRINVRSFFAVNQLGAAYSCQQAFFNGKKLQQRNYCGTVATIRAF